MDASRSRNVSFHIGIAAFVLGFAFPAGAGGPSGPDFSKAFSPDTIGPGSVSELTFTIVNSDPSNPVGDLAFIDMLPAGVTLASPAFVSNSCGGTLSAPDGGGTITFSDGTVGVSQVCTIVVNVTSSTPGTYMNVSGTLTSDAGSSGTASDDLEVSTGLPGFSKSFAPASVPFGSRSTLTFLIDNSANASNVLNLDFTDNLPPGMLIADPADAATTCGTATIPPTLTAVSGTAVVILDANGFGTFPAVAAFATCTVTVDVVGGAFGDLGNVSGNLLASFVEAGKASAVLEVTGADDALRLTKEFTDDPVPPGGAVTLEFTIANQSRDFAATAIAFNDTIDPLGGLTGLAPAEALPKPACGGTLIFAGGTLSLSGATLPPEGSCTFGVALAVPAGATPGTYTNTTFTVTGDVDGELEVGNAASDLLFVEPIPLLSKEFLEVGTLLPDPVVNTGDDVVLRFTVTNTSTTSAATDVAFDDELTDNGGATGALGNGFLPYPVTVVSPALPAAACGGTLAFYSPDTDRQGLRLTGGSLAAAGMAGDSCTIDVTLTIPADLGSGIYTNTTEAPSATVDGATRTGEPASDTLTVIAAPDLSKGFSDDPVPPGGSVTLEFTLSYPPDASGDATDIFFTDDLAPVLAGLVATGLPQPAVCDPDGPGGDPGTGTLSGSAGDTLLTFMGGTLSPGESCTFSVTLSVPVGAATGSNTNTTSGVGATVAGLPATSAPAEDDLTVAGLAFSKEFLNNPVIAGDTTTLRFTIENVDPVNDATITFFTDNLAAVLPGLAATGGATFDDCGGTLSGTTFLTYIGGSVMSGMSCTIEVEVLVPPGTADGDYLNVTSALSAFQGGAVVIDPAVGTLTVDSNLLEIAKEFTDDPVLPGDYTVTLAINISNLSATETVTDIGFADDLSTAMSGLEAVGASANDCGGMATSPFPTVLFVYAGGSLDPGESCTIVLDLELPDGTISLPPFINTTSEVTGKVGSLDVFGDPASDELLILTQGATFSKEFTDDPAAPGEPATLGFTITNVGASALSGLAFSDNLDDVIPGLVATDLPDDGFCGPSSTAGGAGTGFLTVSGASLATDESCTFEVTVTVPTEPAFCGQFTNATSDLTDQGIAVGEPATALFDVLGPGTEQFLQSDGLVSIEAEHFASSATGVDGPWSVLTGLDPLLVSNGEAIKAAPGGATPGPGDGSSVSYEVQLEAGTQEVFIRARSFVAFSDILYFQFDDGPIQSVLLSPDYTVWQWVQVPVPITVDPPYSEVRTLTLYRNEPGVEVDKLVVTKSGEAPTGLGPPESGRATTCDDNDGDGIPDITDPDDDNDGISDEDEIANDLDPLDPDDADEDNDGDGKSNKDEIEDGSDLNDPDSDDDGIGDQYDELPNDPSNACDLGGNADYATFSQEVIAHLTCAARVSIEVISPPTVVQIPTGHLTLIAPFVSFEDTFSAGWLTVINADPCPNCDNSPAPEVIDTLPADFDTDVPADSNIDITFSEPVDVTGDWFEIACVISGMFNPTGSGGATLVAVTDTDPLFTLDPAADFAAGETCYVTVFAAGVTDDDPIDPPDNMDADFEFEFTVDADMDFGDAPDSYSTLFDSGGARHVVPPSVGIHLGPALDIEPDGQPTASADGDDLDVFF